MTATPTPGDLSARLQELVQRVSGICTNEDAARWCLGFVVQYGESISAALSALPVGGAAHEEFCYWHQQEEGCDWFSTGCGREYVVNDGEDGRVELPYCPFCARRLVGSAWTPSDDTTPPPDAAIPDDATNSEVVQQFLHIARTMKPVGQWPGERVCLAIERMIYGSRDFIAQADKAPYRGHNGRGGDAPQPLPPYRSAAAEGETNGFITTVPDKSDRIIWRGHYYHLRPGMTAPADAAVGAQGDAATRIMVSLCDLAQDADQIDGLLANKLLGVVEWWREAKRLPRPAAPAAGKGVDDAMVEARQLANSLARGEWERAGKLSMQLINTLEAALTRQPGSLDERLSQHTTLTRQPVAGDGWRPIESAPAGVWVLTAIQTATHSGVAVASKRANGQWMHRYGGAFGGWTHWMPLPAAPAAAPTDGGEGS